MTKDNFILKHKKGCHLGWEGFSWGFPCRIQCNMSGHLSQVSVVVFLQLQNYAEPWPHHSDLQPSPGNQQDQTWLTETQQAQLLRLWGALAHVLDSCWPKLEIRSQKCHGKPICPWNTRKKARSRNDLCMCKLFCFCFLSPGLLPSFSVVDHLPYASLPGLKPPSIPCLCSSHMKEHYLRPGPIGNAEVDLIGPCPQGAHKLIWEIWQVQGKYLGDNRGHH